MNKTKRKGFTLVELLVVIAIVGLLAAVSIPITTSFIDKAHLSNDIQTASNMSTIVKANQEDISDYSSLKKVIVESFGSNFLKKLKPETSTKGNHYWYNVNEKQVEVKTLQEIRDSKEGNSFDNSFRSSIKKGYYLLDQEGDDELVSNTLTIENLYTRKECDDILSYFEQEVDIASSFSDKLNNTLIINNNGLLRGSMVDQINNIYFSNDYVTITKPIYFEFDNGEINFKSINESSPLLGLGMDNKVINIKSSMFFGTNVLLFKDGVHATLKVDVNDIKDLKSVFGARATNADIQINNDNNVYQIKDDTVINKLTNVVVLRNLQYTISLDVLNYQMPSVNEVTVNQEVSTTNNQVTSQVDVTEGNVSFTIPAGVKVDTTNLELSVTNKEVSEANIVLNNYATSSLDVHIEGINKNNDIPIIVDLGTILPNDVSYSLVKLYHVEDYEPVLMTRVSSLEELTEHNTYYYNKDTGNVTVALKSFSELLLGVKQTETWDGSTIDTDWYDNNPSETEFHIKNANELAGLATIVNRDLDDETRDNFQGKTIYLDNDIIINDWYIDETEYPDTDYPGAHTAYDMGTKVNDPAFEQQGKSYHVFTPIGKDYKHTFKGSFDGQGHTVSGLYGLWYDDPMHSDTLGLFGCLQGPTSEESTPIEIRNLTVSDSFYYYYGGRIGLVTSLSFGKINYKNITLKGNYTSQYNWNSGGIIGYLYNNSEINMDHILIDDTNFFESLWGSYDSSVGGLIGCIHAGDSPTPKIHISNTEIFPKMNVYNDVASNYQWYSYRRSGMIAGYISNDIDLETFLSEYVTYENVLIHYDPIWSDYYYYKNPYNGRPSYPDPHDWKFSRYSEAQLDRTGVTVTESDEFTVYDDIIGKKIGGVTITSEDIESLVHLPFRQLYGGGDYYGGFYNVDLAKLNSYNESPVGISESTSIVEITDRGETSRHLKVTGSNISSPGTNPGYTFTGWNDKTETTNPYVVPASDSEVTAVWTLNPVTSATITGNTGNNTYTGSAFSINASVVHEAGDPTSITYQWQSSTDNENWSNISGATLSAYSLTNVTANKYYRYYYEYTKDDQSVNGYSDSVQFAVTNASLTVTTMAQNGALNYSGSAQTVAVTTDVTAVNNQTITYQYSLTDGSGWANSVSITDAGNVTVYYKLSAPNHSDATGSFAATMYSRLTYDTNNGSGTPSETVIYVPIGSEVTLATVGSMTRSGYDFAGWATSANALSWMTDTYTHTTSDITLYAIWTKTVYLANDMSWTNVRVFAYNGDQSIVNTSWPGETITKVGTGLFGDIYSYTFNADVISKMQFTGDIVVDEDTTYHYKTYEYTAGDSGKLLVPYGSPTNEEYGTYSYYVTDYATYGTFIPKFSNTIMVDDHIDTSDGWIYQWKLNSQAVTKDTDITDAFTINGNALTINSADGNVYKSSDNYYIAINYNSADIFLKVYANSGGIYFGLYISPNVTKYTIHTNWGLNNQDTIALWLYGGYYGAGQWIVYTKDDPTYHYNADNDYNNNYIDLYVYSASVPTGFVIGRWPNNSGSIPTNGSTSYGSPSGYHNELQERSISDNIWVFNS